MRRSYDCSQRSIEELGASLVTGERRRLLDRLRYRRSYRQNQWRMPQRSDFIRMLAWELDLDPQVARRRLDARYRQIDDARGRGARRPRRWCNELRTRTTG